MIKIRKASEKDVTAIVGIHEQAFPDFFLTTLGSRFLGLYYKCMCRCDVAVTLCAIENGVIMGFSATALKSAGFNTRLVKDNIFVFIKEGIRLLFTKPLALIRLMKNMTKGKSGIVDKGEYAELYSIGVSPTSQGRGVGSMLLTETERIIASNSGREMSLTTDKFNNESAIAFYEKNGYRIMYEFTSYPQREMIRYIKSL